MSAFLAFRIGVYAFGEARRRREALPDLASRSSIRRRIFPVETEKILLGHRLDRLVQT